MRVILYSTEGCHLCEQAHKLLLTVGVEPEIVDIAFNDGLFSRYGVTIPVIHIDKSELNWPFNLQQLQQWLDNNGITYHS